MTSSETIYTTIISTLDLAERLDDERVAIVDCRFSLGDPGWGRRAYLEGHIPGAVYAHLDQDLCSPIIPGVTGRHPLPEVDVLSEKLAAWGIGEGIQVVAYDDLRAVGLASAARLWWLLRWLGHGAVAVLDGGWGAWQRESRPLRSGEEKRQRRDFKPRLRPELLVNAHQVELILEAGSGKVFDSRAADRFRGENETLDPVAGHIPGAVSAPFMDAFRPDGHLQPESELRQRFQSLLGQSRAQEAVFYCGSGVTAANNLLAMAHAGLGEALLYAGSWSEWITDPQRSVATGE